MVGSLALGSISSFAYPAHWAGLGKRIARWAGKLIIRWFRRCLKQSPSEARRLADYPAAAGEERLRERISIARMYGSARPERWAEDRALSVLFYKIVEITI